MDDQIKLLEQREDEYKTKIAALEAKMSDRELVICDLQANINQILQEKDHDQQVSQVCTFVLIERFLRVNLFLRRKFGSNKSDDSNLQLNIENRYMRAVIMRLQNEVSLKSMTSNESSKIIESQRVNLKDAHVRKSFINLHSSVFIK